MVLAYILLEWGLNQREKMMSDQLENLADSITMLEQILEVMPQDVDALKALYNANLQSGMADKAFDYLNRLVDVAAGSRDSELFQYLANQYPRFEQTHPSEAAAQQARLRTLLGVHKINQGISKARKEEEAERQLDSGKEKDVTEELALAWRLYEDNQLSQDEYSTVLHDLTEVSTKELDVPATVLHVLSDRGFLSISRIIGYMSERSGVPFVTLANFELEDEAANMLPIEFSTQEGALPFGTMGDCLLVAVLNPFNSTLLQKMEEESGKRCHTFLVEADDYDLALDKLRSRASVAA